MRDERSLLLHLFAAAFSSARRAWSPPASYRRSALAARKVFGHQPDQLLLARARGEGVVAPLQDRHAEMPVAAQPAAVDAEVEFDVIAPVVFGRRQHEGAGAALAQA